jgi:ABC-type dipeptide/oligopeptide/nickel transport system permease component
MTRTTNARIAGFTFLFYIAVALPSMVLLERATSGEGIAAKLASVAQHAADVRVAVVLSLLGCFSALVLAVTTIGALTRIMRSSMMESLRQDYILLARSKGLRERTVVYRHALRNALLPAITVAGLIVAFLLGGAVIVEDVFSWPGVGAAAVSAVYVVDINFIELYVLVTALIIVVANLAVDIIYAKIDPRIRY